MLSKKTKYAIKALTYLARTETNARQPVRTASIATTETIPKKFLEIILIELKAAAMVGSKQGVNGGYYLLKKPSEINLADVIRLFDGAIALLPCVAHKFYEPCDDCPNEGLCGLRSVVADIRQESLKLLKNTTIEDILQREQELIQQPFSPNKENLDI